MQGTTMVAFASLLVVSSCLMIILLPSAPAFQRRMCNAKAPPALPGAAPTRDPEELLLGYDLLTNVFKIQSGLWIVPILRRITLHDPLLAPVNDILHRLVESASKRRREVSPLRNLPPDVSNRFVDRNTHPNKLGDSIGEHIGWKIFGDLSTRQDYFELNLIIVQMASARFVSSTASAMLKFEKNKTRKRWLKEVSKEYASLRAEMRDLIMEFVSGERLVDVEVAKVMNGGSGRHNISR